VIHQPGIGRDFIAAHGHQGHGFRAASNDDFGGAGANAFSGESDGLQARRAEAVDGHRAGFDGESGAERGDAGDVHALFGFGHGAAEDYVVNFFGVEAGNAGEGFLNGQRGEIVGAGGAERAFIGAADGSADGGDDDGFWHGGTSKSKIETRNSKHETRILPTGSGRISARATAV